MSKKRQYKQYTKEFKEEAVAFLIPRQLASLVIHIIAHNIYYVKLVV